MKKLMIVAAVAAMVGGAKADNYVFDAENLVYDFSATLTTTTGKEGKATTTTYYVGVGKSAAGIWWYNDPMFTETSDGKFKTATIGGQTVNALKAGNAQYPWKLNTSVIKTDEQKMELAAKLGYIPYIPVAKDSRKVTGYTNYDEQKWYKNKYVWCETFSFKVVTPGDCYRDTTKVTIKGVLTMDAWCQGGVVVENSDPDEDYAFETLFLNSFGAYLEEKATKVEGLFTYGDDIDKGDGTNVGFVLAGQGAYGKAFSFKEDGDTITINGITSISGSIVGYLPAPDCDACCADSVKAVVFPWCEDTEPAETPTAAYGTWSIKVNKKATLEYWD